MQMIRSARGFDLVGNSVFNSSFVLLLPFIFNVQAQPIGLPTTITIPTTITYVISSLTHNQYYFNPIDNFSAVVFLYKFSVHFA